MQDLGIISPSLEEFRELAGHSRVIPVRLKVLADAETPIGLYRKLAQGQPGTFLMESAAVGGAWSRYSFIGARSRATLTTKDGQAHWLGQPPAGVPVDGSPVDAIRDTVAALRTDRFDGLPPFTSGLVGFLGWETVRHWERLTSPPEDDLQLPEMALNLVTDMAVHDNMDGTVLLIANAINFDNSPDRVDEAWADAVARVKELLARVSTPVAQPVSVLEPAALDFASSVQERWDESEYLAALDRGKEAIVDGEVFQVVISRRFEMECGASPLDVYRVLRNTNPSPYMYIFSLEDAEGREYSIVGSSPEALVTVTGEDVITHPIAGSRPRGKTVDADKALAEELLADQKERAEHLMLVDLSRNDLSKVCVAGSVDVTQFMEVERFSHIMHLVSTVVGRLAPTATAYDVLKATFPAGTLSGAPKPRALRLLDELEPHRRGVYGGVVGYFDFAGDMDMAIAIRSALLREGRAYVQAGGGIVADSVNPTEALETVNKAAAPLRAVHTAGSLHNISAEAVTVEADAAGSATKESHAAGDPAATKTGADSGAGAATDSGGRILMAVPAGSAATDKARSGMPAWARKSTVVLLIAVLALAVFGTTTQTWLTVHLDPQQLGQGTAVQDGLQVQGSKAATTVTALALVALAGGLAASIAGKVARWVITGIIVLAAAGIIAAAATVLCDPLAAAQGSIAAATGVSGSTADVSVTAFPVLAVVAGSLLAVGGLLVVPAGRHWKTRTKYDTAAPGVTEHGTAESGTPGAPTGPVDEIDSWDRLSRGDDPT